MNGNVRISEYSGFCFGVKRAVDMIEKSIAASDKKIFCLGELIHNPGFNESLERRGVTFITADEIKDLPPDALLFIRTHGVPKNVLEEAERCGVEYVDATCPYVKKIHGIVGSQGKDVTVFTVGDRNHPEVQGILSWANGESRVFSGAEEIIAAHPDGFCDERDCILTAQTTYSGAEWEKCRGLIKKYYPNCRVYDTICSVTENRQKAVYELASQCDLTVVVGGRNSSNTAKLYAIAREVCRDAILIESAAELKDYAGRIARAKTKAIAAGASTPDGIIQEVYNKMADITNEELSFAELLDQSFKTLNTGERVKGIVSAVKYTAALGEHPVALTSEGAISLEMEKALNAIPGSSNPVKANLVLELNLNHAVTQKLDKLYANDREKFDLTVKLLYDEACVVSGKKIDDPLAHAKAVCDLLTK